MSSDSPHDIQRFCSTLESVNSGSIDAGSATDIDVQSLTTAAMLAASPPTLKEDWLTIHEAISGWAAAISGDQTMLDTFAGLTDADLVSAQGRVTDYIAAHCGIDLGGPRWNPAEPPESGDRCPAWPRIITPLTSNHFPNLPDIAGSNYFAHNIVISKWAHKLGIKQLRGAFIVPPGGWVEYHGQYPEARYFAYHPNDMDLNNLPTLRDKDLQPDPGSVNPFVKQPVLNRSNYYTARLVFGPEPEQIAPNTSYVGVKKDRVSANRFLVSMLRLYHVDAGNVPGSGNVPLPAVSFYNADGSIDRHFEACDLFDNTAAEIRTKRVFPALPLIDNRAKWLPEWSVSSNYGAPSDTMANADVQYIGTEYSSRFGELLVIRAKFLSAPDTRRGEPISTKNKQVRLYNMCTYNFWNGAAIQCKLDNDLLRDEEGFYTIVASSDKNRPDNLKRNSATWFDTGRFLDGQFQYRFVYRENDYVEAIADGVSGKPISAQLEKYVPHAVHCQKAVFERGGWLACLEQSEKRLHSP
ncbi:MAG: hypothetical protein AB8B48_08225 [Pseudomonadales bacterium]